MNFKKILSNLKKLFVHRNYEPFYKLVDWEKGDICENDKVTIQIVGTRNEIKLRPKEIVAEDKLINGFSPIDVRTITILALSIRKQTKYQVVINDFRESLDEMITIKVEGKEKLIRKSVYDLSHNLDIIDGFSPADAYRLGQLAGEKETIKEYQNFEKSKA